MSVEVVTVAVVESVTVEVTAGGMTVLVDVDVMVDVTVDVGVAAVTVRVVDAVLVLVFVVAVSTSCPQTTEVGYNCGERVHLPFLSLATICEEGDAARAASPRTSRSLSLGTYPGSCVIGVKPGGAGTVVDPETVVVVVAVTVVVCVVVPVVVTVCVPMISGFRSNFQSDISGTLLTCRGNRDGVRIGRGGCCLCYNIGCGHSSRGSLRGSRCGRRRSDQHSFGKGNGQGVGGGGDRFHGLCSLLRGAKLLRES